MKYIKTHGAYCDYMCPYITYDNVEQCYVCENFCNKFGHYTRLQYDHKANRIKRCAACLKAYRDAEVQE